MKKQKKKPTSTEVGFYNYQTILSTVHIGIISFYFSFTCAYKVIYKKQKKHYF